MPGNGNSGRTAIQLSYGLGLGSQRGNGGNEFSPQTFIAWMTAWADHLAVHPTHLCVTSSNREGTTTRTGVMVAQPSCADLGETRTTWESLPSSGVALLRGAVCALKH